VKKKKPKRTAPKPITEENGTSSKCRSERRSEHTPASVSENVPAPVATVKEKQKVDKHEPSPSLPRIVIKIHQGKIVSPSASASSSSSSVDMKKRTTECRSSGTTGISETKSVAGRPQQGEKSDRLKSEAVPKPTKAIAGSKSHLKIASQSMSSKVLSARNVAYSDSSQLENSGSFDKLSHDYCMKLYNQLSTERTSQPPPSDITKPSKHRSPLKPHHTSSDDRSVRVSDSKKRSRVDRVKSTSKHSSKVRAVDASGSLAKDSTPQNCSVQLNRIIPVSDTSSSVGQLSGDSSCWIKSGVKEKSSSGRKRPLDGYDGNVYDSAAGADDSTADCSVTLNPRSHISHSDATLQRTDIPTATQSVPGSSIPLSKHRPTFSSRSHTPTNSDSSTSCSPKKSNSSEIIGHRNSSEKFHPVILSSLLNASVNDHCTSMAVGNSDVVLPGDDISHLDSITDCGSLCTVVEAPSATVASVKMRNSTNTALESTDSLVSDTKCDRGSESSASRKRCNAVDNSDPSLSDTVSKACGAKKLRMSRLSGKITEQLTTEPFTSTPASYEVSDHTCTLLSTMAPSNAEAAVSNNMTVPIPSLDSELPSSEADWMSPSCSQGAAESSSSPLRLRIRRLADMSPVKEMYDVIGNNSAHSALSGMYRPYCGGVV